MRYQPRALRMTCCDPHHRTRRVWTVSAIAPPPSTVTISTHRGSGPGGGPLPQRRRGPRLFRVRDWKVRTKLGAVLTIPAVAFLAVAGVQTDTAVRQAGQLQQFTRQVQLSQQVAGLVHQLQRERDHTVGALADDAKQPSVPADQAGRLAAILGRDRIDTDTAAAALRGAAVPLLTDSAVRRMYDRTNAGMDTLGTL